MRDARAGRENFDFSFQPNDCRNELFSFEESEKIFLFLWGFYEEDCEPWIVYELRFRKLLKLLWIWKNEDNKTGGSMDLLSINETT